MFLLKIVHTFNNYVLLHCQLLTETARLFVIYSTSSEEVTFYVITNSHVIAPRIPFISLPFTRNDWHIYEMVSRLQLHRLVSLIFYIWRYITRNHELEHCRPLNLPEYLKKSFTPFGLIPQAFLCFFIGSIHRRTIYPGCHYIRKLSCLWKIDKRTFWTYSLSLLVLC